MTIPFHLFFSLFFAGLFLAAPACAEPDSLQPTISDISTQSVVNGYLQIQAQLHDTQLAIEKIRSEAAAESKRTSEALALRIQTLEDTIAAQHRNDVEMAQKNQQSNQQFTLLMVLAFGLLVVAAVLFMAYLQWRAVARLVQLAALRPAEYAVGGAPMATALAPNTAVEQSNARLSGAVERLQKRIFELEENSRAPLADKSPSAENGSNKKSETENAGTVAADREECVGNLLAEGQSLMDAQQPGKALECFEVALGLQPDHAEALVKKGGALEKLGRTDEAIACYDRAIASDATLTIAHLHKGGLFNRLARYDEALQCYEQALRTQEKKMPGEKIAA